MQSALLIGIFKTVFLKGEFSCFFFDSNAFTALAQIIPSGSNYTSKTLQLTIFLIDFFVLANRG
jgi:hypothetical protein